MRKLFLGLAISVVLEAQAPYPPSPVIAGATFDWSTHHRDAQG